MKEQEITLQFIPNPDIKGHQSRNDLEKLTKKQFEELYWIQSKEVSCKIDDISKWKEFRDSVYFLGLVGSAIGPTNISIYYGDEEVYDDRIEIAMRVIDKNGKPLLYEIFEWALTASTSLNDESINEIKLFNKIK